MRVLTLDCRFAADKANVCRLQFAPDGRRFAAVFGPTPHTVVVCDTASGVTTWEASGNAGVTCEPAVSPGLNAICWAGRDARSPYGRIRLDRGRAEAVRVFGDTGWTADVTALTFHPSGRWLTAGVYDEAQGTRAVAFWNLERPVSDSPTASLPLPCLPTEAVLALAWLPLGDRLVVLCENFHLYSFAGLNPDGPVANARPELIGADHVPDLRGDTLRLSPDGRRLLALDGRTLAIWAFSQAEWLGPLPAKPRVLDAAYSPDGRTLAVARRDGTATFLDADTLALRTVYDWKLGPLSSVAFAPDGLTCAAGATRRRVVVWDLE